MSNLTPVIKLLLSQGCNYRRHGYNSTTDRIEIIVHKKDYKVVYCPIQTFNKIVIELKIKPII